MQDIVYATFTYAIEINESNNKNREYDKSKNNTRDDWKDQIKNTTAELISISTD